MPTSSAIVVLSPGRSGAPMLSSMLQKIGVDMGVTDPTANPWMEDLDFQRIHKNALEAVGKSWHDPPRDSALRLKMQRVAFDESRSVIQERLKKSLWGWSEPRTAMFFPSYYRLLYGAKFIVLSRNPKAVAANIMRNSGESEEEALALIGFYQQCIDSVIFQTKWPVLRMTYEAILADPVQEVSRLVDFIEVPKDAGRDIKAVEIVEPHRNHSAA